MSEEEILVIAEKIKNKTATKEEVVAFMKEYNKLLTEVNDSLTNNN